VRARILSEEMLDSMPDEIARLNLADIARINRFTRAQSRLIAELRSRFPADAPLRFLDIGAASGDMAARVRREFPQATTVCLDLMHRNLQCAPGQRVQADAFQLPFCDCTFDVVHCSLFLHHFSDAQCEILLRRMHAVSRNLVLIQDLHRSPLSYWFLPFTRWLFGWHQVTVSDGMASVAAGWRRDELRRLLDSVNMSPSSSIRWHFPSFRYFIAISCKR
jgi:SAM-dependent methyltransferase